MTLSLSAPIAGPLGVAVHGSAVSTSSGYFEASWPRTAVPLRDERIRARVVYAGSPRHGAAQHDFIAHVGRPVADVEVEVHPTRVTTDLKDVRIAAFIGLIGVPQAGRTVVLALDGVHLTDLRTGNDGWAETRVPLRRFLPAGLHTLTVNTPDGPHMNGHSVAVPLEVMIALRVSLRVVSTGCADGGTCVEGEARAYMGDGRSRPVAGAAVTLHADRRRLGSLQTGKDGRFAGRLRADVLAELFPPGVIGVVAEVRVAAPYYEVGWGPVIAVDVPPPSSPSEWIYAAFLLLIVGGFGARRLLDRHRERSLAETLEATSAGLNVSQVRHVGGGALDDDRGRAVRGVVLHGETGRPTRATLQLDGPTPTFVEAPAGRFDLGELASGAWRLTVRAPEHEVFVVDLSVPHDGTFRGCELLPHSCRAIVRGRFSALIARHTGRAVDWRVETPSRVEGRWMRSRRRGHAAIRGAVDATDAALYGRRTDSAEAQRLAQTLAKVDP